MRKAALSALALAAALSAGATGCGGTGSNGPTSPPATPPQVSTFTSAHFVFHHTALDAANVAAIAAAVEAQYARITSDLGVASMPVVAVHLHPDRRSLQDAVLPLVGTLPSFATGLATAVDRIHMVSPNAAAVWSYEQALPAVVHEFVHCASLRLNPTIANNPRWLWESVALYEAGQAVDARGLPYMTAGTPPSLAELDRLSDTRVYDVGHSIGAFVVETHGRQALVELVRANGDTGRVLGLDAAAFTSRWYSFVRARYGF